MRFDQDEKRARISTLSSHLTQLCEHQARAELVLLDELSQRTGRAIRPWVLGIMAALENGPLSQGQLAQAVRATPPTISKRMKVLARVGLVERRAGDEDGRRQVVALTHSGSEVARTYQQLREEWLGRVFVSCGAEDLGPPTQEIWRLLLWMREAENR